MSTGGLVLPNRLDIELLEPTQLFRLYSFPGGQWDPPEPKYRNLRVDPPDGKQTDYAVLYTAENLVTAAVEARVLVCDANDNWTWSREQAGRRNVARYRFSRPAVFLPIDGENFDKLGLPRWQNGYGQIRETAHALWTRYASSIHGLSWNSRHRNQASRVYALWHHHKDSIDLKIEGSYEIPLLDDPEWQRFLDENPQISMGPES